MPLLHLDKIEIRHTTVGILCPKCGGDLKALPKQGFWQKLFVRMDWKASKTVHYQCQDCNTNFKLIS